MQRLARLQKPRVLNLVPQPLIVTGLFKPVSRVCFTICDLGSFSTIVLTWRAYQPQIHVSARVSLQCHNPCAAATPCAAAMTSAAFITFISGKKHNHQHHRAVRAFIMLWSSGHLSTLLLQPKGLTTPQHLRTMDN